MCALSFDSSFTTASSMTSHKSPLRILPLLTRGVVSIACIGAGIGIYAWLYYARAQPSASDPAMTGRLRLQVTTPIEQAVGRHFRAFGQARAVNVADVPARVTATVISVHPNYREGATVAAGDALVSLDSEDFQRQLTMSDEALRGIDARLSMLELDTANAKRTLELVEEDARLAQAEMAYRMQTSVPDATDLSSETDETFELYGASAREPGTYAANCLLARRLVERGVRFVQLFHQGWDQHGGLPGGITQQCAQTDQASAALVMDLKRRGLLEDTLVVWGGEFGRTAYCQGRLTATDYGRDHHPRCFSIWLAGGGVKAGHVHGSTDDFGYNIASDAVDVHDLHATILRLMGVDHERLTYRFQGRHYRLTDVSGTVVNGIIA